MNELQEHVDKLFRKYSNSPQIADLKQEVLSNLEAKRQDFISGGMDESLAIAKTIQGLTSIDHLIDGNVLINKNQYNYQNPITDKI